VVRGTPLAEVIFFAGVLLVVGLVVALPKDSSPMPTGVIALAAAVGFGLAAGVWSLVASKRKRQAEFGSRELLTAEDIFATYYGDSGLDKDVVVRLWNECAAKLRIPPEKLRPTDRFEHELGASDFWASLDDTREDLARYAMAHAKRFGGTIDLKGTKTLDELIRQLAAVETQRPTA
jgi:hypothetical protein